MLRDVDRLLARIKSIHEAIRSAVLAACEEAAMDQLAAVVGEEGGDTIFAIDRVSETTLLEHFAALAQEWPCVLIAEGLGATGCLVLPGGLEEYQAEIRVIVDPIDGTRGLMYQKRPAWILTGVAPNHGPATTLDAIELAVQTEIPLLKQHLCDTLWARQGHGATGSRLNRLSGEVQPLVVQPSRASTIAQGYGGLARFFPGARAALAAVDDAVIREVLGPAVGGQAQAFEDQYIATGGQLYELMMGHDRWIADLRPLVGPHLLAAGDAPGHCCHPYDLCTELIAREAGVVVTATDGQPLRMPLDVWTDCAWVGYANSTIAAQVAPVLQKHVVAQLGSGGRGPHVAS